MAEKNEGSGEAASKEGSTGTVSDWWIAYIDKAAAAITPNLPAGLKFECPSCRTDLREDPKFLHKVIQGNTKCPECKHDLKELLTESARFIGGTIGQYLPMEWPYCGESSPGNNSTHSRMRRQKFAPGAHFRASPFQDTGENLTANTFFAGKEKKILTTSSNTRDLVKHGREK